MDKVRYAGDLSQDDAPDLLQAFPVEEPNVDDEMLKPIQVAEQLNTCKQTSLGKKSCDRGINNLQRNLQRNHKAKRAPYSTYRYSLRAR